MKTPTFSEVMAHADLTTELLRSQLISHEEAIKRIKESEFYLEHWKILTARTTGYTGLGYLNN